MIDEVKVVANAELPVDEMLTVKKHRLAPDDGVGAGKRISVVTGIHGDELEGQYVCYEVARRIKEHPEALNGIVDIYPAMNPFGIDSITRGIPAFDLDMNRIFPGNQDGDMNEYLAAEIIEDVLGTDLCVDIHASNIFLTEIPQIRINELHKDRLVPIAQKSNVDFIWVHGNATVLKETFAFSLNSRGVDTLVVEMGVGMRTTKEYGDQMVDGIFAMMAELGIWTGEVPEVRDPILSYDEDGWDVYYLNAPASGMFVKTLNHGTLVKEGDEVGIIINPLSGELIAKITSPADGWLFTIREYPVVEDGSLMGRVLKQEVYDGCDKK